MCGLFTLETSCIVDLEKTFTCGQCFRWERRITSDGEVRWCGFIKSNYVELLQVDEYSFIVHSDLSCSKISVLISDYFDLDTEYNLKSPINEFEQSAFEYGVGIRILRQDFFEVLVSFILSQQSNIKRISACVESLCDKYGCTVPNAYGRKTFPTLDSLSHVSESDLRSLGYGFRSRYLYSLFRGFHPDWVSFEQLKQYLGVGDKVANCVRLFGCHDLNSFPIDVWMNRILYKYYDNKVDINRFNGFAGVAQQCMFAYERFLCGK